jgi:hypothetical protein
VADDGGKVVGAQTVLRGPDRIGPLYYCMARYFTGLSYGLTRVNGEVDGVCEKVTVTASVGSTRSAIPTNSPALSPATL